VSALFRRVVVTGWRGAVRRNAHGRDALAVDWAAVAATVGAHENRHRAGAGALLPSARSATNWHRAVDRAGFPDDRRARRPHHASARPWHGDADLARGRCDHVSRRAVVA